MTNSFIFTAPPIIIVSPPPRINVEIDHTFIINCTALGVPTPEIVWRLNWGHVPDKCTMTSTPQGAEKYLYFCLHFLAIYLFSFCEGGNQAYGEIECPDAKESDQGAYSCEAINIKGFCLHKYLPANFFSYI